MRFEKRFLPLTRSKKGSSLDWLIIISNELAAHQLFPKLAPSLLVVECDRIRPTFKGKADSIVASQPAYSRTSSRGISYDLTKMRFDLGMA